MTIHPWPPLESWTHRLLALSFLILLVFSVGGCGTEATPSPEAEDSATPGVATHPASTLAPTAVPTEAPQPEPASASTGGEGSIATTLTLDILSPVDGAEVDAETIAVIAKTRPDAMVAVNGVPADVSTNGRIKGDVRLEEGGNVIEVVAADLSGGVRHQSLVVFYLP